MPLSDDTIQAMAQLLPKNSRQRLFKELWVVSSEPKIKNVAEALHIRRNEVYRYCEKRPRSEKKQMIPDSSVTYRIIKALLKTGNRRACLTVLDELDRVYFVMKNGYKQYEDWKKEAVKGIETPLGLKHSW